MFQYNTHVDSGLIPSSRLLTFDIATEVVHTLDAPLYIFGLFQLRLILVLDALICLPTGHHLGSLEALAARSPLASAPPASVLSEGFSFATSTSGPSENETPSLFINPLATSSAVLLDAKTGAQVWAHSAALIKLSQALRDTSFLSSLRNVFKAKDFLLGCLIQQREVREAENSLP